MLRIVLVVRMLLSSSVAVAPPWRLRGDERRHRSSSDGPDDSDDDPRSRSSRSRSQSPKCHTRTQPAGLTRCRPLPPPNARRHTAPAGRCIPKMPFVHVDGDGNLTRYSELDERRISNARAHGEKSVRVSDVQLPNVRPCPWSSNAAAPRLLRR